MRRKLIVFLLVTPFVFAGCKTVKKMTGGTSDKLDKVSEKTEKATGQDKDDSGKAVSQSGDSKKGDDYDIKPKAAKKAGGESLVVETGNCVEKKKEDRLVDQKVWEDVEEELPSELDKKEFKIAKGCADQKGYYRAHYLTGMYYGAQGNAKKAGKYLGQAHKAASNERQKKEAFGGFSKYIKKFKKEGKQKKVSALQKAQGKYTSMKAGASPVRAKAPEPTPAREAEFPESLAWNGAKKKAMEALDTSRREAKNYDDAHSPEKGYLILRKWALKKDNPEAMYLFAAEACKIREDDFPPPGYCPKTERAVKKRKKKLIKKAARLGNVRAMEEMALYHTRARTNNPDKEKAKKWLSKILNSVEPEYDPDRMEYEYETGNPAHEAHRRGRNLLKYYTTGHVIGGGDERYKGTPIYPTADMIKKAYKKKRWGYLYQVHDKAKLTEKGRSLIGDIGYEKLEKKATAEYASRLEKALGEEDPNEYFLYKRACTGSLITGSPSEIAKHHDKACEMVGKAILKKFRKDVTCSNAFGKYEQYYRQVGERMEPKIYHTAAEKLTDCGKWETFWTKFVHIGDASEDNLATTSMIKLEESGKPILSKLKAYLRKNSDAPFDGEYGAYAALHVAQYLQKNHKGMCGLAKYAKNMSADVAGGWLEYLQDSGCSSGIPVAARVLEKGDVVDRATACNVLQAYGASQHRDLMEKTAEDDPDIDVRIECWEALDEM